MSKSIWFTSDTHYGHGAIIRHCSRPFVSVAEMDATMIANWNAVVGPEDDVYHLGDFAFYGVGRAEAILNGLKGRKHLIFGNHDRPRIRSLSGWSSAQPYLELPGHGHTQKIVLCHYAMRVWNKRHWGAWMLYGHSHGTLAGDRQSIDVGVDVHGFRPVSIKEIAAKLARLPDDEAGS